MSGALEAVRVTHEQLPSPHRPVGAVAGPVEDHADRLTGLAVLRQARGEMGVMVLHPDGLDTLPLERVLGREIFRVEVVRDQLGPHSEERLEMLDPLGERAKRLVVLQVPDVMADPGATALGDTKGVLQLGPTGEDRRRRPERQIARNVAARPPQEQRAIHNHAKHGIVGPSLDRPVVHEEQVRDPRKPLQCVLVAVGDGLVRDVRARHHQHRARVIEQQVVERRVGQHHAELSRGRRDRVGDRRAGPARREHDGPLA